MYELLRRVGQKLVFGPTLGVFCLVALPALGQQENCIAIQTVEQQGREFIDTTTGYQKIKQNLINSLLRQSVEQVLGKKIAASSSSELQLNNDELSESLNQLSVDRAKGFVSGYSVLPPGEQIIEMGGMAVMEIKLSVDVCIPDEDQNERIVAIGGFENVDGQILPNSLNDLIAARVTANESFSVIRYPTPRGAYFDFLLTGKVTNARVEEKDNAGGKMGASIFGSLTGMNIPTEDKIIKAYVNVAMQLEDVGDQTVSTYIGSGKVKMSARYSQAEQDASLAAALDLAIEDAVSNMMYEIAQSDKENKKKKKKRKKKKKDERTKD